MEQQQGIANGRSVNRRSEEEILKHLDEQEKSGFTVKEYCEAFDIVEQTFYSWLKKYQSKLEEPGGFGQVEIVPVFGQSKPQLFAEIGTVKLYKEVPAEYLKTLLS